MCDRSMIGRMVIYGLHIRNSVGIIPLVIIPGMLARAIFRTIRFVVVPPHTETPIESKTPHHSTPIGAVWVGIQAAMGLVSACLARMSTNASTCSVAQVSRALDNWIPEYPSAFCWCRGRNQASCSPTASAQSCSTGRTAIPRSPESPGWRSRSAATRRAQTALQ